MQIAGYAFITAGILFMGLGVLGLFRMPDVFNKLQAGTKATTLGLLGIIIGAIFLKPEWTPKLLVILMFVLLTNPVGSHALARASHKIKSKIVISGTDKYESGGK